MDQPPELWKACSDIFAKLGINGTISFVDLQNKLHCKSVCYTPRDMEALLWNWKLDGKIEDNGGPLNEYSSFKNLSIEMKKVEVDSDPEKLDFPNGRVSE